MRIELLDVFPHGNPFKRLKKFSDVAKELLVNNLKNPVPVEKYYDFLFGLRGTTVMNMRSRYKKLPKDVLGQLGCTTRIHTVVNDFEEPDDTKAKEFNKYPNLILGFSLEHWLLHAIDVVLNRDNKEIRGFHKRSLNSVIGQNIGDYTNFLIYCGILDERNGVTRDSLENESIVKSMIKNLQPSIPPITVVRIESIFSPDGGITIEKLDDSLITANSIINFKSNSKYKITGKEILEKLVIGGGLMKHTFDDGAYVIIESKEFNQQKNQKKVNNSNKIPHVVTSYACMINGKLELFDSQTVLAEYIFNTGQTLGIQIPDSLRLDILGNIDSDWGIKQRTRQVLGNFIRSGNDPVALDKGLKTLMDNIGLDYKSICLLETNKLKGTNLRFFNQGLLQNYAVDKVTFINKLNSQMVSNPTHKTREKWIDYANKNLK